MNAAESATIIGPSTKVRGELNGTDSLLVEGEVEGSISLPGGRVTIGSKGRVRARIFAQEIVVSGRVHGDLLATGSVHLRSSAMVLGNVVSPRFVVEEDALLRGQVEPSTAAEPTAPALQESSAGTPPQPLSETMFPHELHASRESGGLPAGLAAAERQVSGAGSHAEGDPHGN